MNIIVIESLPSSKEGGQPLSTLEISQGLYKRGHSITLIYFSHGDLVSRYEEFCNQLIYIDGGRLKSKRPIKSALKMGRQILYSYFQTGFWGSHDLIYLSDHRRALFAVLFASLKHTSTVLHLRTPATAAMTAHKQDRWPISRIRKFIAVSDHLKSNWRDRFKLKDCIIETIHNGTNTEYFRPAKSKESACTALGLDARAKIISYIGRLSPDKGLPTLLEAFSELTKDFREKVILIIAGQPSGFPNPREGIIYEKFIRKLSVDLGISKSARFLGHINEPLLLYQASDVTVLPSIYPEPFGRSIIESMACGVPVIATHIGGIPEILSGNLSYYLFEPYNINELTLKLKETLKWRENKPDLGAYCRNHVRQNFESHIVHSKVEKYILE